VCAVPWRRLFFSPSFDPRRGEGRHARTGSDAAPRALSAPALRVCCPPPVCARVCVGGWGACPSVSQSVRKQRPSSLEKDRRLVLFPRSLDLCVAAPLLSSVRQMQGGRQRQQHGQSAQRSGSHGPWRVYAGPLLHGKSKGCWGERGSGGKQTAMGARTQWPVVANCQRSRRRRQTC